MLNNKILDKLIQNELGYWEVKDKPTDKDLEEYYAQKYYQECKGSHQKHYSQEELDFFTAKVDQRAAMVARLFPNNQKATYLDVGCGEGFELAYFKKQGWRVKGLDFSSDGMQKQNPECLEFLETGNVYELLNTEIESGRQYDVVWLQNVLEHVIDPKALLQQLKKLVSKEGCAVITVPNDFSELQKAALDENKIDRAFWVALPDHLSYFDANSLKAVTEDCGWHCAAVTADFPIDWFLMNAQSNYIQTPQVGKPAHHARVSLENLIQAQPMDKVLDFWLALAAVGMGRNITAFIQPAE